MTKHHIIHGLTLPAMFMAGAGAAIPMAPAMADEPAAQANVLSYDAQFFAASNPGNALDMVDRLPGFVLVDSDEDVRGFAGSSGNVLIDGAPPASKTESLKDALRRIPAGQVVRIDVVRAGAKGIDMGGHDVVANVIRRSGGARSLTVEGGAIAANDHVVRPLFQADFSRTAGGSRIDAAAGIDTAIDEDAGSGTGRVLSPQGAVIETEDRRKWEVKQTLSGKASWSRSLAGGDFTANANVERQRKSEDLSAIGVQDSELVSERQTDLEGEAGLHWRRGLGAASMLDVTALRRMGRLRNLSTSTEGEEIERFVERGDSAETIARISLRRESGPLTLEGAAEGAINSLDSRAALSSNGVEIPLPGDTARVTERRGELSASGTWHAGSALTLDTALRIERSRLSQQGDTMRHRDFTYWKPRLAVSYAPGGESRFRLAVEREAGQLDFGDFVASASLDRDNVSAGATDLRPSRTWRLVAGAEYHFGTGGAIVIEARREWIDDVVDHTILIVPGEGAFDVVGNIGRGRRDAVTLDATIPMEGLIGLSGARLVANVTVQRSRVGDPVTGEDRWISKDAPVEGRIEWQHDLPGGRWSWGAYFNLPEKQREYQLDEVRMESYGPGVGAHLEYRPAPAWTLRLEASNLTSLDHIDRREKYDGVRGAGGPNETEIRRTDTTPTVSLTLRRRLGSAT